MPPRFPPPSPSSPLSFNMLTCFLIVFVVFGVFLPCLLAFSFSVYREPTKRKTESEQLNTAMFPVFSS